MKGKSLWLVVSCLMMVVLVLSSCRPAPVKEEKEVTPEVKKPQYGGTLHLYEATSPPGWDPAKTIWRVDRFINPVYEKPIYGDVDKYGPRGKNLFHYRFNDISPPKYTVGHLIESWEFPEPTHLIYHVRKGIHFQDKPPVNGREMDAKDVALSLRRIWEVPRFKTGYWKWVKSIEATDKYTVEFKFKEYNSMWKWFLGYGWYTDITPRELVEQDLVNKWQYACGTGPFILTDYNPDVGATYKRNPNYWDTTPVRGKEYKMPFVDKLKIAIIKDTPAAVAAIRTGKLDMGFGATWFSGKSVRSLFKTCPELKKVQYPYVSGQVVHVRCDMEPTDDIRVRRALMLGIDNQAILDKMWVEGTLLNILVQEGMEQYIPVKDLPDKLRRLFEYHPDEAKELLAEAGYPDGFKTKMLVASWATHQDMASLLKSYWKKIGVDVKLKVVDPGVLYSTFYEGEQPQMLMVGRGGLHLCEAQAHGRIESVWDISRWDDPKFIKYLEAGLAERDPAVRNKWIKKMNLRYIESCSEVILPFPYTYNVWWPWVKNYYGERDVGYGWSGPTYARVWIDQEMKEDMGY